MTSVVIPGLDLVPSLPSRVVTVDLVDMTEGEQVAGAKIDFFLPADLHVPADDKILQAGRVTLTLNASGHGKIRLPAYTDTVRPVDWVIGVKKHWAPHPYFIRVPAGSTAISLADIPAVQTLPQGVVDWMITGAAVTVTQGAQWDASLNLTAGILRLGLTVPPGGEAWARGSLPPNTDLNTLTTPGVYRISSSSLPVINPPPLRHPGGVPTGFITITNVNVGGNTWAAQEFIRYGENPERWWRISRTTSGAWNEWTSLDADALLHGRAPDGTDWDDVKSPGVYIVPSLSVAQSMQNLPVEFPGTMEVIGDPRGSASIFHQIYYPSRSTDVWRRATQGSNGFTEPWVLYGASDSTPPATTDYGLANQVLQDFFTREMGGIHKTGGLGAVAFRIDHGLANFNSMYRPLFEARNIPYALAISSRRWDHPENEGVTPAMVNTWVEGGLCEIWNHGATAHDSVHGYENIYDYWVTGREELETQIPAAKVWGAAPPGTGDPDAFDGMGAAQTAERIYGTTGGQVILGSHAVLTGTASGHEEWVLDGKVRQGNGRLSGDSQTAAQLMTRIDSAVSLKRGLQIFFHPSVVGGTGNNGIAKWTEVLDHVVAERDAGRLVVLSPYQMLLADATGSNS